jgi:PAS domain S-box-containing protein
MRYPSTEIGPQPIKADGHIRDGDSMPKTPPTLTQRYGIVPILIALATAVQLALDPLLGDRLPCLAFFVAIAVSTWYGGLRPSLLAVALSWLAVDHFLLQPRGPGPIVWEKSLTIFPFFAIGLTIALLTEAVRDARNLACASAAEARRANEAQQAQREWLRITLASIGDAVITTDPEGQVTSLNPAAERLIGSGGQEAIGRPLAELFRTSDGSINGAAHEPVTGVVRGEAIVSGHRTTLIERGGATRYVEHNAAPISDDRGEVTGVVIVLRDITERRQAEQALRKSELRFRHLADAMPQIVWTATPDGSVDYFNARWYEYTGLAPEASLHEGWRVAVHPDDLGRLSSVRDRRVAEGQVFEAELRVRRRDGAYRWHLVRSLAVPDEAGDLARRFGAATDIDDRKRAEDGLRDADRRKDEFLAMLAHELRNPLAPIRNAVTMMALAEDDREAQRWSREVIDRQVQHLSSLVDDLLDVGRITQGKITLTKAPLSVRTFLTAAVEASHPLIAARKHRLEVALPEEMLWVEGDPTRLAQVISNLLNNAAKYTPEGGHIRLSVGRDGDEAVIRVKDSGEGIAPEMLPRVFDLFSQASQSIDRSEGGLGIGLTLVKRLVEMHGGTVEARSDGLGHGSEFVVRLPLLRSEVPVTPPPGGEAPGPGRPRRILVVDDSRDSADTLARLLRRLGHEVEVAYEGPSAYAAAVALVPDIVLLDIGLPGMDGYEVARRLRAEPSLDGVCLVALTGYGSEADRRRSTAVGFDTHLVKPVEFGALRRLLDATQVGSPGGPG